MPQIEKPDDLQLIANHPVFLYERRLLSTMEITQNSLAVILTVSLTADLSDAALNKSSAVYGHIDENGSLSVNLSEILAKIGRAACLFGKGSFFARKKSACQRTRGRELKSKQQAAISQPGTESRQQATFRSLALSKCFRQGQRDSDR